MLKSLLIYVYVFIIGYILGAAQRPTPPAESPFRSDTCSVRCFEAVHTVRTLWPQTGYALTLARIIPKTELACERICLDKDI